MKLNAPQLDALREMVNIGVGQAAGVLNAMLASHVELRVPIVEVLTGAELRQRIQSMKHEHISAVRLGFKGPFSGNASLIFLPESAAKLVIMLTGDDNSTLDLDSIRIGALTEVGNIVLNGIMGAIGNELKLHLYYSVPSYLENPADILMAANSQAPGFSVVWVQTSFTVVKQQITGDVILLFEVGSLDLLVQALDQQMGV